MVQKISAKSYFYFPEKVQSRWHHLKETPRGAMCGHAGGISSGSSFMFQANAREENLERKSPWSHRVVSSAPRTPERLEPGVKLGGTSRSGWPEGGCGLGLRGPLCTSESRVSPLSVSSGTPGPHTPNAVSPTTAGQAGPGQTPNVLGPPVRRPRGGAGNFSTRNPGSHHSSPVRGLPAPAWKSSSKTETDQGSASFGLEEAPTGLTPPRQGTVNTSPY